MTSIPKIAVDNILPPQPLKRTRLKADLESIFSGFNVIEKPNQDNRFNFGTGHHYIHFMDGAELYVDSDGSGIYVDIAGFRSLFIRPKKQQEALRREIVKELMNASDLELLRSGVRRFFAKRAVRELGILKLRRYGTRTLKKRKRKKDLGGYQTSFVFQRLLFPAKNTPRSFVAHVQYKLTSPRI
ncbi:hypothetical protein ACHAPG_000264 [Botrytis cinerea]